MFRTQLYRCTYSLEAAALTNSSSSPRDHTLETQTPNTECLRKSLLMPGSFSV
ncbi:uncharacterized protein PHALS_00052 [Plasmopara halstedii]|uniref:Uncharacterized protein n=1 Tax=Plasmopara halstedii TaxID=4781 RepID=A0A0N7L3F3_PLAHL|nr:uncharacterized protein PHALS_00052 [Plasmopara halstedii]CEG35715.1 hypothetical protein PHALS_00052 [Plasmopara halstedii]|eukprot:XP_024572084.1 hypothetical protein PHALS_00052 [Plasmopara halstedii]